MPGTRLAARGESLAAVDGRCIPAPPQRGCRVGGPGAACVAPRSNTPGIATPPRKRRAAGAPVLGRRALPAGRLARLGATPDFHHGLLDRSIRAECVAPDCSRNTDPGILRALPKQYARKTGAGEVQTAGAHSGRAP